MLLLVRPNDIHIFPNAAGIVLRPSDNSVAFVVEGAREDFVFVTFTWVCTQALDFITGISGPQSARLVATRRDDLVSLWVKRDFTDFILVAL